SVTQSGPLRVDKSLRDVGGQNAILSYQIYHTGSTVRVFRIEDINGAITVHDREVAPGPGSKGNVFPVIAIDTAGNLYAVYSQGANQIFMATSTDRGDTWSAPKEIGNTFGTNIMPWIIAGDPGRVAIVWYNSNLDGNPNVPSSVWNIYMAQTLNALDAEPTITYHKANHTVIHYAQICLNGLGCNLSVPMGDRGFLEFPSVTMDENGAAAIVYNDNTNQPHHVYVMVAKQLDGPSLLASVGDLSNANVVDPGSVTLDTPADATEVTTSELDADGTHTLPALNFDRDEAADALFPDHGPVIGANIPALDLSCVSIEADGTDVTVTMELDDLSLAALAAAPALSGGDGVLYVTQWDYKDDVYWLAAEVRAGVAVYHTGGLAVVTSGTSTKYMTYNPNAIDSASVVGSIDMAAGMITMSVPRELVGSPGDGVMLHHVTGYAMSQRGPLVPVSSGEPGEAGVPNPSSFPIKVDASGGFSHRLGDPLTQDGIVELSIDDGPFSSPIAAETLGTCNADWTASLDVSSLSGGTHTLCARQVINGRGPSPAECVTFTIPDPDTDGDGITDSNDNCMLTPNFDQADQDSDSVGDVCDNCLLEANPDQCNTNAGTGAGQDQIGNVCDADLNNDGIVNSFDLSIMRSNFGASGVNDSDITCDGIVNSFDLSEMRTDFGQAPGPSGIAPPGRGKNKPGQAIRR
ncbi:MAG: thrombospondin type 3 repeat-containing protein, partial [Gammaproteobacteria bacterium]|nr:thrombospondin type 3 repeat-containing protein [Gammaproteobacteria bacterium]